MTMGSLCSLHRSASRAAIGRSHSYLLTEAALSSGLGVALMTSDDASLHLRLGVISSELQETVGFLAIAVDS